MTLSANIGIELTDPNAEQLPTQINEALVVIDAALSQIDIAMTDADYTLSTTTDPEEWQYKIIRVTGALTAARNVVAPLNKKEYTFVNDTTGGFPVTLKTGAGTGVAVEMNDSAPLRCDGTNIVETRAATASPGVFGPQSAHYVLAGPTSGSPADPTFRAMVAGDLPVIEERVQLACSDRTTALVAATNVASFRAVRAKTLIGVRASLDTVSSSGLVTVDINVAGSTVLSTKLSIDASEKTSTTAATPAVISSSAIADDAEISIDIDAAGTGAKGLVVTLIWTTAV